MKKFLITFLITVTLLLPCFAFGSCGADNYSGKQYRLTGISATYNETVSDSVKSEHEATVQTIKNTLNGENAPFCKFYTLNNVLLTNCNGNYRFTKYKIDGGQVTIDTSTSTNTAQKVDREVRMKFLQDDSLERAVFSKEKENLLLTETFDGITVKYTFVANGDLNESPTVTTGSSFSFIDVSYTEITTNEEQNKEELESANSCLKSYRLGGAISFPEILTCNIFHDLHNVTYDFKQDSKKNEHLITIGDAATDQWNNLTKLYLYGDLLISTENHGGFPTFAYFIKDTD